MPCGVTASSSTTKTSSIFRRGGGAINLIAYIPKTAYHVHLGPAPFDSAPQTLPDMELSFLGELPFKTIAIINTGSLSPIVSLWLC